MQYVNAQPRKENKAPTIGMKKKVLYLVTKSNFGGAQRYVYDLATSLPNDQFDPVVACGGNGELVKRLTEAQIPVIGIPSLERDIMFIKEIRALFSIMDVVRSARPDILHVNSSKAGALGAFAGRLLGIKKIIFTIHGWPFREKRSFLWRVFVWSASLVTLIFSTQAIAVSKKDFEDSPWRKKTIYIKNGIRPFETKPRAEARALLSRTPVDNELWVGTIAELTRNKGIDILINVAQSTEDSRFVVIGDGEERERLGKLVETLEIKDRVTLRGNIPDAYHLLSAFDIFILPSRKEGLPYTVLEAGVAGLPVIASAVGGVPEIIRNGETGILVPPEDEKAFSEAIKSLLEHPEKRTWLGRNLRALVEREYSFAKMLEETLAVYT